MTKVVSTAFLGAALMLGALVACGGGDATPQPKTPDSVPSSSATVVLPSSSGAATAASGAGPAASAGASASAVAPVAPVVLMPIVKSTLADKLKEAGLDPKKLPRLSNVERSKLGKVMNTFTAALGYKCTDCHLDDFKASTPMKRIAEHMWDEYAAALAMSDGSPLYCDSCHQGRGKILDRTDKKVLSGFMQANFVDKVKRNDKKEHGCPTCHGDPFEPDILGPWSL